VLMMMIAFLNTVIEDMLSLLPNWFVQLKICEPKVMFTQMGCVSKTRKVKWMFKKNLPDFNLGFQTSTG